MRVKREDCCDKVASSACANDGEYAGALTALEEYRSFTRSRSTLATAADGGRPGSLRARIQRLVEGSRVTNQLSDWWLASTALLLALLSTSCAIVWTEAVGATDDDKEAAEADDRETAEQKTPDLYDNEPDKQQSSTPANCESPQDNAAANPSPPLPAARFHAAVALSELGDAKGVEWLIEKTRPNDFGSNGTLFRRRHFHARTDRLEESCMHVLADLSGLPPSEGIDQWKNWWAANQDAFVPGPVVLEIE